MLERRLKDKLPAMRDIPKKKLLGETAKVENILCKLAIQTHSNTKNNDCFMQELLLLHAGWSKD